jgi:phosphoribosylformylglycinamidine synthase
MEVLFPPGRRIAKNVQTTKKNLEPFNANASLQEKFGVSTLKDKVSKATELVFQLPSVGSKNFLITIGDRTVGGLAVRDQLVGPWQTPVADVAVTLNSFSLDSNAHSGEAMAM